MIATLEKTEENIALQKFRSQNPDLFKKSDLRLSLHLLTVLSLFFAFTAVVLITPFLMIKILLGVVNAYLLFSLINVTIHHHHTHHNAAQNPFLKKVLDIIYLVVLPNAPKRLNRYTRAHLNHHARPFHESDVDHHHGKNHFFKRMKNIGTRAIYFLELTFVGGHVPGWQDDHYMNQVPLEEWNCADYEKIKEKEKKEALRTSLIQWGLFIVAVRFLPWLAWGWAFPMLLVKNWAHFLGQFQHFDDRFLDPSRSVWARTKTYHFPSFLNYLTGGEISGHFLHHLFPEMPYYNVERARKRLLQDPELTQLFVTY